jgi:hypothetical protein
MADIDNLIADARTFVTNMTGDAETQFFNAQLAIMAINPGSEGVEYFEAELPDEPAQTTGLTAPTFDPVNLNLPPDPSLPPEFQDIAPVDASGAPTFDVLAPDFDPGTKPSQLAAFETTAPTINTSITFPTAPEQLLNPDLSQPTLTPRSAKPTAPAKVIPSFDAVAPVDTSVAPENLDRTMAAAYDEQSAAITAKISGYVDAQLTKINPQFHTQMAAIEDKLTEYLDGSTGLDPANENQIYERARGKGAAEYRRVVDTAYATAATRGFTRPPGAVFAAVQAARQGFADNNAASANEIAVKQVEWKRETAQFALTTSIALRNVVINATLAYMQNLVSINGQALDYAKTVASMLIETYNIQAKVFATKLDAYKAAASVYESRLRGVQILTDIYKTELQVLEIDLNVNRLEIDLYKSRIDSLGVLANLYKTQIEAVKGRVDLEKLGLEVFQLQVQTYSTMVQAKNSEWQGYTASINGEEAKSRVFTSQASVFSAQMNGYKTKIDAQVEQIKAVSTTNDARSRQYTANLGAYETQVRGRVAVASGNIDNQKQKLLGFDGQLRLAVSNANLYGDYFRATSDTARQNAKLKYEAAVQSQTLLQNYGNMIAQLNQTSATYYGNSSQAALAGMNTLAASIENT